MSDLLHSVEHLYRGHHRFLLDVGGQRGNGLHLASDAYAWVLVSGQVQHSNAIENNAGDHSDEGTLDSLLGAVPLATQLHLRLAVEHAQLVAYVGKTRA